MNSKVSIYADNIAIELSDKDPVAIKQKLNDELENLTQWFHQNELSLNLLEPKLMIFGTRYLI